MADDRGTRSRVAPIALTICALGLAVVHLVRPNAAIDATTLALLAIAALPWLGSVFKSVELPGGIKAEYRERIQAIEEQVGKLQVAVFSGATPDQADQLNDKLTEFIEWFKARGVESKLDRPVVDVKGVPPDDKVSEYDPLTNRILIKEQVASDPVFMLREYSQRVLCETADNFSFTGPLVPLQSGLPDYLVCSFRETPLLIDPSTAESLGFEVESLDEPNNTVPEYLPDIYKRGRLWAQALWRTRAASAHSKVVDESVIDAWREAGQSRRDEPFFLVSVLERLDATGDKRLSEVLRGQIAEKGLT